MREGRPSPNYHCNVNNRSESSYRKLRWPSSGPRMTADASTGSKISPARPKETHRSRLLLIGANHRTSPLDEREALVRRVTYAALRRAAGRHPPWGDAVLLSTCNRVEAYALTSRLKDADRAIRKAFGLPRDSKSLYRLEDFEASAHLFRVASGLDSVAQGERQVADQVRRAPSERPPSLRTSRGLDGLFERAARAAGKIRALAELDDPSASASQAAVRFIQAVVSLPEPTVALIGSGKMARLAANSLKGRADIVVVDRNLGRAKRIARDLGGRAEDLRALRTVLQTADVVVAATAAPKPLVSAAALRKILEPRRGRPSWIVDLGVPRNVDPKARDLPNVTYVDIDGLGPWASRPPSPMALARAEARIHQEARKILASLVAPRDDAVAALRRAAEGFRVAELDRALDRLPRATEAERAVLDRLTIRLVNRILHGPTQRLREVPERQREAFVRSFLESWRNLGGDAR